MISRSPKSKFLIISGTIAAIIAIIICVDSLLALQSLSKSHGERSQYLITNASIELGDELNEDVISIHEMFSNDAPANALELSALDKGFFASIKLAPGTILTSEMTAETVADSTDSDQRIVYIPTQEKLSPSIASQTDLISFSAQGFGSDIVAKDATILFDASINRNSDTNQNDSNAGYFVIVDQSEALEIARALSMGEVRFALIKDAG